MTQKEKVVKFWGALGLLVFLAYLVSRAILIYTQMSEASYLNHDAFVDAVCFQLRLTYILLDVSAILLVTSMVVNIFVPARAFESNG